MPTEQKVDYTAEQTTAYEAYLSAVAEHNIICARPTATTREKMDAATAAAAAHARFVKLCGIDISQPGDAIRLRDLKALMHDVAEMVRSAYSMVFAANGMGVIERRPEGIGEDEHDACVCLFMDAQLVLRSALAKAETA
ncbi:MAG: hypothetical protein WBL20_19230 [Sphingobium sp.]|uniref:hypothetical protein n=1 Tax=Sphingobium sp. TaxID=1912891 RepID=UPI003BB10E8C